MFCSSHIELSKPALRSNLRFVSKHLPPGVVLSAVIKGNAYGHGIDVFLPMAEECGVRHFSVFDADEAVRAVNSRKRGSEIMIMGSVDDPAALTWAIEQGVQFYIFDLARLDDAIGIARRIGRPARVHLEIETGLHRMGLQDGQLEEAIRTVKEAGEALVIEGTCTHFAGAESIANYVRIQQQLVNFEKACQRLREAEMPLGRRHTACSAAALRYPETIMDMVRVGIAMYGFWPNKETEMDYYLRNVSSEPRPPARTLRRVLRWSSRVMNVKEVPAGEFIGYGTSYMTTRRQQIAAVPVGYFHGFARNLSNLGFVLIHGKRCNVVGVVNMNMIMVDVTHIDSIRKGDEVVVIGRQNKGHIDVASFSDLTRILNYEVLVRLPSEIPRVVVN